MPPLSVLDLVGKDAAAILHNLTTNEVKSLEPDGPGAETFITNVKGKCLGHVLAYRTQDGYRLIGASGQSDAIAAQMDKYTIREDAVPRVLDDEFQGWLIVQDETTRVSGFDETAEAGALQRIEVSLSIESDDNKTGSNEAQSVVAYAVPWVGSKGGLPGVLIMTSKSQEVSSQSMSRAIGALVGTQKVGDAMMEGEPANQRFHQLRVSAGFPWYGTDFNDSHLPQEISREPQTISFTKGCYLGQETIARLDALGQVQKKLVRWSVEGIGDHSPPDVDTKLFAGGEKAVGRLTSVAAIESQPGGASGIFAIGFARRSHFEAGAEANGTSGEREFVAKVVGE